MIGMVQDTESDFDKKAEGETRVEEQNTVRSTPKKSNTKEGGLQSENKR